MCGGSLISAARTVEVGDTLPHLLSNLPQDLLLAGPQGGVHETQPYTLESFPFPSVETVFSAHPLTPPLQHHYQTG